jgi:hypothetical protein
MSKAISAFPLSWPFGWARTPAAERVSGDKFKILADQIRNEVFAALKVLRAENIIVSSNVPLRADGTPAADVLRRPLPDPGVAIYFTIEGRPLAMARDNFKTPAANLRSLTWALRAMRQLEIHGGDAMAERAYAGFTALPPPRPALTTRSCWEVLDIKPTRSETEVRAAYRRRARVCHPDAGGTSDQMADLQAAYEEALREAEK